MDFKLTPQQELFKKAAREFCDEKVFPRCGDTLMIVEHRLI